MELLDSILENNIRLFDYETITVDGSRNKPRLVAFGGFAGRAGMISALRGLGERMLCLGYSTPFLNIGSSYMYPSLNDAKSAVRLVGGRIQHAGLPRDFSPLVFGFTGNGNVSQGAQEVFEELPHEWISPNDLKQLTQDGETKLGSKSKGHTKGGETLGNCIKWCQECGVKVLSVYAFSTENWKRDANEVDFLMKTFEKYANEILVKALKNNIRVNVLASEPELLPMHIRELFHKIEEQTINNTSFSLNLCVSYGGRSEIIQTTKKIVNDVLNGNIKSINDIDENLYENYLLTKNCYKNVNNNNNNNTKKSNNRPIDNNPDLLIRTSGECRLSNFLLYQLAYSEMIFVDKFWPEFTKTDLIDCINTFSNRKRRYGK
jgi:undecaprenyl diphosphate synthase